MRGFGTRVTVAAAFACSGSDEDTACHRGVAFPGSAKAPPQREIPCGNTAAAKDRRRQKVSAAAETAATAGASAPPTA